MLVASFDFVFLYPGHLQEIAQVAFCCLLVKGGSPGFDPQACCMVTPQSTEALHSGRERERVGLELRVHPRQHSAMGSVVDKGPPTDWISGKGRRMDLAVRCGQSAWAVCVCVWEAGCLSLSSANDQTPSLEDKQRGLTSSQREVRRWRVQAGFSQAQGHAKARAFSFSLDIPRRLVHCV